MESLMLQRYASTNGKGLITKVRRQVCKRKQKCSRLAKHGRAICADTERVVAMPRLAAHELLR
jgi:hypothetical protein